MSRPPATCHPDRPHAGRGLCHSCLNTFYRRRKRARYNRECPLCGKRHRTIWRHQRYCSGLCRQVDLIRDRRPDHEDLVVTRDGALATSIARSCKDRGMRKITPKTSGSFLGEPYWTAWRSGPLYLIRIGDPA